ncbi:hypothetical protein WDZ92_44695, partial [Nostoc sp. NIES-2111]
MRPFAGADMSRVTCRPAWLGLLLMAGLNDIAPAQVTESPIAVTASPLPAAQWLQVSARQQGLPEGASVPREIT